MSVDPRFLDLSAMMRDGLRELERLHAEVSEEEALTTAGAMLAASIAFFVDRRPTQYTISMLEAQLDFLVEVEARRQVAEMRRVVQ